LNFNKSFRSVVAGADFQRSRWLLGAKSKGARYGFARDVEGFFLPLILKSEGVCAWGVLVFERSIRDFFECQNVVEACWFEALFTQFCLIFE
jgi:hypothetical protein